MTGHDDFADYLRETLTALGPVTVRRMFGGAGVFLDGLMFGLIADDALYLKADDGNRAAFEAEGLEPFAYERTGGHTTIMSYHRAPDRLLDEPEEMQAWAREAMAAAKRSSARTVKKGRAGGSAARRRKV